MSNANISPLIQLEQPQEQAPVDLVPADTASPRRPPTAHALQIIIAGSVFFSSLITALLVTHRVNTFPATIVVAVAWESISTTTFPSIASISQTAIAFLRVIAIGGASVGVLIGTCLSLVLALRVKLYGIRNDPARRAEFAQRWRDRILLRRERASKQQQHNVLLLTSVVLAVIEIGLGIGVVWWWHGGAVDIVTMNPQRAALCVFVGSSVTGLYSALTKTSGVEAESAENEPLVRVDGHEEVRMEGNSHGSKV